MSNVTPARGVADVVARRALLGPLLAAAMCVGLAACGDDEKKSTSPKNEIAQKLEDVERVVPEAKSRVPSFRTGGKTEPQTIDGFLTETIQVIDRYWTRTLTASGLPEPRVNYVWVAPGQSTQTKCVIPGTNEYETTNDLSMSYCPADDTIYFAQVVASKIWEGITAEFPGTQAGYGNAVGDFGLAHTLAHEYGHNMQYELQLKTEERQKQLGTKGFELHADCLAGLWENSAYAENLLDQGDVEEAIQTAKATGDLDPTHPGHHGTPEERAKAREVGFSRGNPADCNQYLEQSTGSGGGGGGTITIVPD
jgi:predicted metalloprotease